ncbi:MAG TPA: VTT domain-containing protein [Terriglobales bacterium]|nr:VTT domain-containing protein [Terriglobales bacterium]
MNVIKKLLQRYTAWLWHILGPLGPWGVFVATTCDGAFVGLPVDAVFASYVYHDRAHLMFYITMASAGAAIGSTVLYFIGYLGGEKLLRKRMSAARYEKIHASFEKHEFWALMFPAMLPPPTPFKLFVLAAAVAEMRFVSFLAAIFAGRFIRFAILGFLTIRFGPQVVRFVAEVFRRHWIWVLIAALAGLTVWIILQRRGAQREGNTTVSVRGGKIL